jgi:hypothetical protein
MALASGRILCPKHLARCSASRYTDLCGRTCHVDTRERVKQVV